LTFWLLLAEAEVAVLMVEVVVRVATSLLFLQLVVMALLLPH
jgi:hypothetical protein